MSPGCYSTFYEDSNMSIHGEGHYNALFLLWSVGFSCIHLFHFNGFWSAVWLRGGWTFMSPSMLTVFSFLLQPWKRCSVVGHRQFHLLFILFCVSFSSSKFLWELIFSPANLFFSFSISQVFLLKCNRSFSRQHSVSTICFWNAK